MGQRTVNARQLEVLRWVADGCPDGVMKDTTYKTTAVALQNRHLIQVTKKKGLWQATATDAGKHFIEHGAYPAGHWLADTAQTRSASTASVTTPKRADRRRVTGLRPVDQMIADVVAAGGTLDISDPDRYYESLVSSATRFGKVPEGKLLRLDSRRGYGEKTLRLVDKPGWMTAVLAPIPVAERLARPHPVVVALRADRDNRLLFKRDVRQRALRVLDALAKEATRRGYVVTCPQWERNQRNTPGALLIEINGHPHALHVTEEADKVPHEPTAKEVRDFEKWGYPRIPKYDKVPSGRLTIAINGGIPVRQSAFGDTKTLELSDRLPVLLQELELRAANSEERRLKAEQDAAERRRRWERLREAAIVSLQEDHRAKILTQQVHQWREARSLAEYLAAMEAHLDTLDGDEQEATSEWLTWAKGYSARLDPLNGKLAMPERLDPTPEALKPFMRGHSPYGPDAGYGFR